SFPPFFGDPKKGGAGVAGARSPEARRGLFCVWRYGRGKTYMNGAALLSPFGIRRFKTYSPVPRRT
ncbi:MAG: hypothetical protein ACFNUE_07725, partial [Bacteroides sp.]